MQELWPPDTLVRTTEAIHLAVRDRYEDVYDGVTEKGAGPFSVVVPGHSAAYVDDYIDPMDALPWADEHPVDHPDVYLDTQDDLDRLFQKIDAYTDGAVLIEGDGRIYPYTVQLTPDVTVEEGYEEGWGTKTRTALDVSAVDVDEPRVPELPYVKKYFPDEYRRLTTAADHVWDAEDNPYGDIVSIATSSATGGTRVFSGGEPVRHHDGVIEKRDMDAIWERVLQTTDTEDDAS